MKPQSHSTEIKPGWSHNPELFQQLIENASDIIWIVDMNMRMVHVNASIKQITGYSAQEAMERTMQQAYSASSFALAMETFSDVMRQEKAGRHTRSKILVLELNRKDGSTVNAEVNFSFLRDRDGKPQYILAIARDISERIHTENALKKKTEELEMLNRHLIDRELKMMELKKRIQILEKKMGTDAVHPSSQL